jgi:hypothetical protein
MFDLPSSLKTAIDALTFTPRTVTVFKDEGSTARALGNLERLVFSDAAVIIGDWEQDSEPRSFGWSTVRNSVELLLCAKGADAIAALKDGSMAKVLCEGLNRTTLNNNHHIRTQIETSEPIKIFNEKVHYQILTALVVAVEPASTNFTPLPNANAPTVSITAPAASAEIEFTTGVSNDLAATVSVAIGDASLLSLLYVLTNTTQDWTKIYSDSSPDNGANAHTFTIANGLLVDEDSATVTVYIYDSNMMFGSHTHAFTWAEA